MNKRHIQIPLISLMLTGCSMTEMPDRSEPKPDKPHVLSEDEKTQKREEIRNELYEYQFELIKAGKPPMDLPMTPELKKRLEDEGMPIPDRFKE